MCVFFSLLNTDMQYPKYFVDFIICEFKSGIASILIQKKIQKSDKDSYIREQWYTGINETVSEFSST